MGGGGGGGGHRRTNLERRTRVQSVLECCQSVCIARDDKSFADRKSRIGYGFGRLIKGEIPERRATTDKAYSLRRMDRFRFRSLYGTLRPSDVLRLLNQ